ncbi:hypothetical protein TELCIR_15033 [Teladorsagia circumcincta]|uniref:Uncharacterized protein n=1 Tax=Teladorsagia circumcincta TaxID=45464 RepID=A0A2G9TZM4_TELCI|nr:hypothetical protein TELCIR_15033 [Teladorsagia circumcincta]
MLYGSECWALNKNQERQLHSTGMRMLRWACGWTRLDKKMRLFMLACVLVMCIVNGYAQWNGRTYGTYGKKK